MYKMYEQLKSLKEGQKITLISFGEFGFAGITQTTFKSVEPKPHYQNCGDDLYGVRLIHKPRRKRTYYQKSIDYNIPVLVYNGWIDATDDCIWNKHDGVKESKYTCFDNRNLTDIENNLTEKPILKINY